MEKVLKMLSSARKELGDIIHVLIKCYYVLILFHFTPVLYLLLYIYIHTHMYICVCVLDERMYKLIISSDICVYLGDCEFMLIL